MEEKRDNDREATDAQATCAAAATANARAASDGQVADEQAACNNRQVASDRQVTGDGQQATPTPTRKRKRWPIVVGVCALVLVVAGIGFTMWHEQPSFCNAICHSPMDDHVEQYHSGDENVLVCTHAESDVTRLGCHTPDLGEQVSEGIAWVTGDFSDPMESRAQELATRDFCLRCHDDGDVANGMDWSDIVASTADYGGDKGVNPHSSHNGEMDCGNCHSMHGTSTLFCNECHTMDVPEGWE